MNFYSKIITTLGCLFFLLSPIYGHSHLETDYVPWGVDEYELFGLTRNELTQKFKGTLNCDPQFKEVFFIGYSGPEFLLTFKDNHVCQVQRMFVDGAGCHIMGPLLHSKKEALEFSINGLSKLPDGGGKQNQARLMSAKKLLKESENSAIHR